MERGRSDPTAGGQQEFQGPGKRPVYETRTLTGRFQLYKILAKVIYGGSGCRGWEVGQGERLPRVTDLFIILTAVRAVRVHTYGKTHRIAQCLADSLSITTVQQSR